MGCPSLTNLSTSSIAEQFSYYIISAAILILRGCVRLRTRGWRRLQADDYIAVWVLFCVGFAGFFTIASLWLGGTWFFLDHPDDVGKLLECQIDDMRLGSIFNVLNWYMYTGLIWGLKAMMLIFLNRLYCCFARLMIRSVAVACALSFLTCYIIITFSCHPIQKNWQVNPLPHHRCMRRVINIYSVSGLNAATDFLILLIPLRLVKTVQVSIWKKVVLVLLLCSGALAMVTALLRVGFLHTSTYVGHISMWGSREVMVGTFVVNMPLIAPIIKKSFWQRITGSRPPLHPTDLSPTGLTTIGGTRIDSHGRHRHTESDDSSVASIPDDNVTGVPSLTMINRNDSAANTTIKTTFSERIDFHAHNGESRNPIDADAEDHNPESGRTTTSTSCEEEDLARPTLPEPVVYSPRSPETQSNARRNIAWPRNATPRSFELTRIQHL
ncbi:uncharacterized protein RCC_06701 [Ramularia collo-cygni]|uniref:Rhodopsin domain-containing protein n=1 Tax=Ramularia collo-cygni TaxID=112498 RepID=A0A2D3UTK1_9PEZI|nr:uncharacterized protein RCC_06701 [Ramularia collo-cygni]CZT20842.1 uncharacterized protein RCC_06701 [Ramularia collo-cygni]